MTHEGLVWKCFVTSGMHNFWFRNAIIVGNIVEKLNDLFSILTHFEKNFSQLVIIETMLGLQIIGFAISWQIEKLSHQENLDTWNIFVNTSSSIFPHFPPWSKIDKTSLGKNWMFLKVTAIKLGLFFRNETGI